jgi:8-oxo-dGTP pyrophosphatase MutT (NUDIX family)
VLLVTSRGTKRWIIPKGWPIKGLKPSKAAAREAYEEAGVRGRIAGRAFGHYVYEKRLEDSVTTVPCEVEVFPLLVKRQLKDWPESKQRTVRWFPAAEAAALVGNDQLHNLIRAFQMRKGSSHRKSK